MDTVEGILDWISQNSRNLSEAQKNEIYGVLESLTNQLPSGIGSSSQARDHQTHHFPQPMPGGKNQNEKKYYGKPYNNDKNSSLESKINRVTNSMSKETGYINGKIDTLSKEHEKQIKMLKNQIKGLQKDKIQKEREKNKVSDSQITNLTESLKSMMKRENHAAVPGPYPYPPNPNLPPHPPPPYDYFPSYPPHTPMPPMPPNQHFPHFPNHHPPQFHPAPRPPAPGPSMASPFPFPGSYVGPNIPKPPPYEKNEKVYRFSGNNSGYRPNGKGDYNAASGSSDAKPIFDKLFSHGNDGKADGNSRKKYCDPVWKKSADRHTEHEPMKESPKKAGGKFHHKFPSRGEQPGTDSDRFSSTGEFKKHSDRGKNKRHQQFGKNRPQNYDDGCDSDTSTASQVPPSKDYRKESTTHKTAHFRDFKGAPNQNPQPPSKDKPSKLQNNPKNSGVTSTNQNPQPPSKDKPSKPQNNPKNSGDTSTPSQGPSKKAGKKSAAKTKTEHSNDSGNVTDKNTLSSVKNESSELRKLEYPPKAEALKKGLDLLQRIDPPGSCLGKINGVPFSRPALCLKDIYDFEEEFGHCEVIRF